MKFILGKKIRTSQIFDVEGKRLPVTLVLAGPCVVTQIKSKEKDGYFAIQLGFEKLKKVPKSKQKKPFKYLREFRVSKEEVQNFKVGQEITVSIFKEGDLVKISGLSKGKGFAGAVKRWGFSGRGASHGVKHEERTLGAVGASSPPRVIKGKKMPGRLGGERVTIKNLEIVKVDPKNNLLAIKGAIPGPKGNLLEIRG